MEGHLAEHFACPWLQRHRAISAYQRPAAALTRAVHPAYRTSPQATYGRFHRNPLPGRSSRARISGMTKTRWMWVALTTLAVLAALGAGLWFGGGPTTRNGWEAAAWAAAITATLGLPVNVVVWAATKSPNTPRPTPAPATPPSSRPATSTAHSGAAEGRTTPERETRNAHEGATTRQGDVFDFRGAQGQTIIGQQNNLSSPESDHGQDPHT